MCYKHINLQSLTLQELAPSLLSWYRDTGNSLARRYLVQNITDALNKNGSKADIRLVSSWLRDRPRVGRSPSLKDLGIIAAFLDSHPEIPYGTEELTFNLQKQMGVH